MKVSTIGGKPLMSGGKVVTTPGRPCACGDCGGAAVGGSCCIGAPEFEGCVLVSDAAACAAIAGLYNGDGTLCTYTCSPSGTYYACTGACCAIDDSCSQESSLRCGLESGGFEGYGTICTDCTDPLGCCSPFETFVTESICTGGAGAWAGAGIPCPCP